MNPILVVALMAISVLSPQQKQAKVKATVSGHQVVLSWTASSDGAANPTLGYNVYRGTSAGGEGTTAINSSLVGAGCNSPTTCTYTDTPTVGTYFYTVKASLNAVLSGPSNEVQAVVPLSPPTGLAATAQ